MNFARFAKDASTALFILMALTACSRAKLSTRFGAASPASSGGSFENVPNFPVLRPGQPPEQIAGAGIALLITAARGNSPSLPAIVTVSDKELYDAHRNIFRTSCPAGKFAVGGYCRCEGGPTWVNGTTADAQYCACLGQNPTPIAVLVRCVEERS